MSKERLMREIELCRSEIIPISSQKETNEVMLAKITNLKLELIEVELKKNKIKLELEILRNSASGRDVVEKFGDETDILILEQKCARPSLQEKAIRDEISQINNYILGQKIRRMERLFRKATLEHETIIFKKADLETSFEIYKTNKKLNMKIEEYLKEYNNLSNNL